MKNKKVIIGITIGLCVCAVGVLIYGIVNNMHKPVDVNQPDVSQSETSDISEQSDTTANQNSSDDSQDVKPDDSTEPSTDTQIDESSDDPTTTEPAEDEKTDAEKAEREQNLINSQHEEWLPALSEEKLSQMGESSVLNDKNMLNNIKTVIQRYKSIHTTTDLISLRVDYLEDARCAYLTFTMEDGNILRIYNMNTIYQHAAPKFIYVVDAMNVTDDKLVERGFTRIKDVDMETNASLFEFLNDDNVTFLPNEKYTNLTNLTINDL